jgi:curved DNA-binding protein
MQTHIADPYVVLGVPRSASRRQMAEAYRRLAKRHHPDVDSDPAAAERMRRVNAVWRALSDPGTRAQHAARAASSGHWTSAHTAARRARTTTSGSWAAWGPRPGDYDGFRPRRASSPSPIQHRSLPPRPRSHGSLSGHGLGRRAGCRRGGASAIRGGLCGKRVLVVLRSPYRGSGARGCCLGAE